MSQSIPFIRGSWCRRGHKRSRWYPRTPNFALSLETLEDRRALSSLASFDTGITSYAHGIETRTLEYELMPGDANQDLKFDQRDLVQVLHAGKYLTGKPATWSEGDWNGVPGGSPGSPPPGDGLFDQRDIMAALSAAVYDSGPYAALRPDGVPHDHALSIVYDHSTGEISLHVPPRHLLTSINIDSASGIFTEARAMNLDGTFDQHTATNIFKATFGGSFGSISFGNVAQPGLDVDTLLNDLTVVGSGAGAWDFGEVDLIYCQCSGNLAGADFQKADLANMVFSSVSLAGANFQGANLSNATFFSVSLDGASFQGANLSNARFFDSNLREASFQAANLTRAVLNRNNLEGAQFSGAIVQEASFVGAINEGFTEEQLYSSASYQQRDLSGIDLSQNDLSGWNFSGQNLEQVSFADATLTSTDFSQAIVREANFAGATSRGFTQQQLYSTASYLEKDLQRITLDDNDLSGWNFAGHNLTGAGFSQAILMDADLSGANLTEAFMDSAALRNADLTDAIVRQAYFVNTTSHGFTREQLYSTASYQEKDLEWIVLADNDLSGWSLAGQNLTWASFGGARLAGADLTDAVVTNSNFNATTGLGFTKEQLYSTVSYHDKNLYGIGLDDNDLSGWNFAEQDLTRARLQRATLTGADLRGVRGFSPNQSARIENTILPDGRIESLGLKSGDRLVVRDHEIGITVDKSFVVADGSTIEMVLDDANWTSTVTVSPNVTPQLGGFFAPTGISLSISTLGIAFSASADPSVLAGATFDLFDWGPPLDPANHFGQIDLPPGTVWDLSRLYITGQVTLTSVLQAGDANGDLQFDQKDIVQVLQAAKYLTGQPATFAEGDFNEDGLFNQLDIVAALETRTYQANARLPL